MRNKCIVCGEWFLNSRKTKICSDVCRKQRCRERNNRPEAIKKRKEYNSRPEVVEKRKEYDSRPEVVEKRKRYRKRYYSRPEIKERKRRLAKEYCSRPENMEKMKRYMQEYFNRPGWDGIVHALRISNKPISKTEMQKQYKNVAGLIKIGVVEEKQGYLKLSGSPLVAAFDGFYQEERRER